MKLNDLTADKRNIRAAMPELFDIIFFGWQFVSQVKRHQRVSTLFQYHVGSSEATKLIFFTFFAVRPIQPQGFFFSYTVGWWHCGPRWYVFTSVLHNFLSVRPGWVFMIKKIIIIISTNNSICWHCVCRVATLELIYWNHPCFTAK